MATFAIVAGGRQGAEAADVARPTPAQLEALESRVAAIERLLGTPNRPVRPTEAVGTDRRYLELRERVSRITSQHAETWGRIPSILPVPEGTVSSPYAYRFHPIRKQVLPHYGIDIAAPHGTPILAAADGTVVAAGWDDGYGNAIDIDHGNGFITRYAHASRLLVRTGDIVRRGETIALVGSTGIATGPHLHYEIFRDGFNIDPAGFVLDGAPVHVLVGGSGD